MWRAITGCLPTKDNLKHRKIEVNRFRLVCNIDDETTLHTLVSCSCAKACWQLTKKIEGGCIFSSFKEYVSIAFQQFNKLWITFNYELLDDMKNRNDIAWNEHRLESSDIVESANTTLNQWQSVQDRSFDNFLRYMSQDNDLEH